MNKWLLPLILGLAFLLRIIALDSYPVGFTPDEASFGYDAYSLLKTGKDQWGNSFPLVLKSFGDYKAPVYAYLTMPSVAIFGLTKFAVRLPNALLGVAAVYVLYLLVSKLLNAGYKLKLGSLNTETLMLNSKTVALVSSLILAVSPWHIMMSRGAFEANLITFFVPLGIYLFLKERYYLSATILGLSMFTYHSAKFIAPLIFVALIIVFRKKVVKPIFVFCFFLGLTVFTFSQGAGARVKDINIFSGSVEEGSELKNIAVNGGEPYFLSKMFHNKFTVSFDRFINNYVSYFSPQFLLTKGPAETTYGMMPGTGVLNFVEFIGLLVGLFYLFLSNVLKTRYKLLILFWLLVSAVPASLATGPGYAANRAVAMVPVIQIISAIGICYLIKNRKVVGFVLIGLGFLSFSLFAEKYLFLSPQLSANGMLSGNLEIAKYLETKNDFEKIVVSKTLSEPHIYIAFAMKTNPKDYQEATKYWNFEDLNLKWVDQMPEYRLGKYVFKKVNASDSENFNTFIVGRPDEFKEASKFTENIYVKEIK